MEIHLKALKSAKPSPVYFGCLGQTGHYFHSNIPGSYRSLDIPEGFPWGLEVDGGLQPHPGYTQGHTALHRKDGWTLIAWWDMTVDRRPASCSAIALEGDRCFEEMVELLRQHYPQVAERQTVPLYE